MAQISRALYKSLLRAGSKLDRLGAAPAAELGRFSLACPPALTPASTFQQVVRQQFKAMKACSSEEAASLQNLAMRALAQANSRATSLAAPPCEPREEEAASSPARPSSVLYSVGQTFRHQKYGYRAVIIGWDTSCKAGASWVASTGVASLPHGTAQPFYRVLVDVRDRPQAQVSYVAQDNIALLSGETAGNPLAGLVVHPLVTSYFSEYRPAEGYYVAGDALAEAYPLDNPALVHSQAARASSVPAHVSMLDLRSTIFSGRRQESDSDSESDADEPAATRRPRTSSNV